MANIEERLTIHRGMMLDKSIYLSRDFNQRLRFIRARSAIKRVELVMNSQGYLQRRIKPNQIVRVTETHGESVKSYACTLSRFVEMARIHDPIAPFENQVMQAKERLEHENQAVITIAEEK